MVLYCKMKLRQLKGAVIDSNLIHSRRERAEISDIVIENLAEAKKQVEKTKESWKEVV